MNLLGIHLTLLIGPNIPTPAPPTFLEALDSVEVTHNDEERSGFQLMFKVGRGQSDVLDYALLNSPLLQPFNRVVLVVTFGAVPQVLMDGIITHQQLSPGERPGGTLLTITGEDVSVMMDLEEKSVEHPAQPEAIIALKLISSYAQYGLIPMVIPPPTIDIPLPTERIPVQQNTDLVYLQEMASRFAYVFYITPGPAPLINTAYWGPPQRIGIPQRALSVNMGPNTNVVGDVNFQYNSLEHAFMEGILQDRQTGLRIPVQTRVSTRTPLVSKPAWLTQSHVRTRRFSSTGLNTAQAYSLAQAETDRSMDRVLTATGELDATRYETLLKPRGLVGLRGVGFSYDGFYYVKSVTHRIRRGEYHQSFTLTREGQGAISPVVVP
jgi:hypothetical protein